MATDDKQILVAGTAAAPADWLVPGNGQIQPKAINAVFDGTGAASNYAPTIEIVSDAGVIVARVAADTVVAGASAEVTWAPFLRGIGASGASTFIGCRATNALGQLIGNNTPTDLLWHAVDFDTDGMTDFLVNQEKITCRTTGYYWIGVSTEFGANNTGDRQTNITLNGLFSTGTGTRIANAFGPTSQSGTAQACLTCATIYHLTVGDYVTAGVLETSGLPLGLAGGPQHYFAAALLG